MESLLEDAATPTRFVFFGWKVIQDGLATQVNKRRRHFGVSDTCIVCEMVAESSMHALVRCPHVTLLRIAMPRLWCEVLQMITS